MKTNNMIVLPKIGNELSKDDTRTSLVTEYILSKNSMNTRENYARALRDFFKWAKADITEITRENILWYRERLIRQAKADSTIHMHISVLRDFFRFIMDKGLIQVDPTAKIRTNINNQKETEALTLDEIKELMNIPDKDSIKGQVEFIALKILFNLGLRVSELTNMRFNDIKDGILTIKGKGNKVRRLPLNDNVLGAITSYQDEFNQLSGLNLGDNDYVIQTNYIHGNGTNTAPVDRQWVALMLKRCTAKTDITKHITPHSCRASAITLLLDQGVSIRDVAIYAGHSKIATTEIYDKRLNEIKCNPSKDMAI